jgi:diacylglycerol kinase (ATP)
VPRMCLILNPAAGQKAGLTTNRFGLDDARELLARHELPADIFCTERAAHATELAREAAANGYEIILAAGGDGTVAEVAESLIGSQAVLGVLPLGSVMNVARMLGVPRDLEGAIQVVKAGRVASIDIGWARASARQRFFLEAAGVGIDAGLFAYVNQIDLGNLRSIPALVTFLRRFRSRRLRLQLDGQPLHVSAMMVTVANGPYLGAALPLAPDAKLDDAQFDVKVYTRFSKFELARHFLSITRGRRPYNPKIISRRARIVEITAPRPMMAHADSHALGTTPARFELRPAALRVFIGDQADCPPALRVHPVAAHG